MSVFHTKVAVFCRKDAKPEILFFCVQLTQEQYDAGNHFIAAAREAYRLGYDSCQSFTQNDPAGKAINLNDKCDNLELIVLTRADEQPTPQQLPIVGRSSQLARGTDWQDIVWEDSPTYDEEVESGLHQ